METVNMNEPVIPAEMYPFSNPLDRDVTLMWDGKAYTFAALSTTNLLGRIPNATPEHIQGIRKHFAYKLAQQMFFETDQYKKMEGQTPANPETIKTPAIYSEAQLEKFVQKCLEPLHVQAPEVKDVSAEMDVTPRLTRDGKGRPRSRVVAQGEDIKPIEDPA